MAFDPLPENPTTEEMRAFCRSVARTERGERRTLLFGRYFPLGHCWPALKLRDKAEIKLAGGQKSYCQKVLGGLSETTARLSEDAAAFEPHAQEILDWWDSPNRNQFTDWKPSSTWTLLWFIQIAERWTVKNVPPPAVPAEVPAGTGEQPTVDPGFLGPRPPLWTNLTAEEAEQITTRAARVEEVEAQILVVAEQFGQDMLLARNVASTLLQRVRLLEDELLRLGHAIPPSEMTDDIANWLAGMDETPARALRRIRRKPNQITTAEELDAALEPALGEITAMVAAKAADVHRVLLPVWNRTPANLRNDLMGLADLSFMSTGTRPAGDVLFWTESDSPFEDMEAVERTNLDDLRVVFSSSPPKPPQDDKPPPDDDQPDISDQADNEKSGDGDKTGDHRRAEHEATIKAALGDLQLVVQGKNDSFWFFHPDRKSYGLVEKIRDEPGYRYGSGQGLSNTTYPLADAVRRMVADRTKAERDAAKTLADALEQSNKASADRRAETANLGDGGGGDFDKSRDDGGGHPLGELPIKARGTPRLTMLQKVQKAFNGVEFSVPKLSKIMPKDTNNAEWREFLKAVDDVFHPSSEEECPIEMCSDERAIGWTDRAVVLRRGDTLSRLKVTAQNRRKTTEATGETGEGTFQGT